MTNGKLNLETPFVIRHLLVGVHPWLDFDFLFEKVVLAGGVPLGAHQPQAGGKLGNIQRLRAVGFWFQLKFPVQFRRRRSIWRAPATGRRQAWKHPASACCRLLVPIEIPGPVSPPAFHLARTSHRPAASLETSSVCVLSAFGSN